MIDKIINLTFNIPFLPQLIFLFEVCIFVFICITALFVTMCTYYKITNQYNETRKNISKLFFKRMAMALSMSLLCFILFSLINQ